MNFFSLLNFQWIATAATSRHVRSRSLFQPNGQKEKLTGIAKPGAAEIQARVINLVEIEFAILMNSLHSEPKTNRRTFISFNNRPASQTLCRLAAVTESSPPLPLADKESSAVYRTPTRVFLRAMGKNRKELGVNHSRKIQFFSEKKTAIKRRA